MKKLFVFTAVITALVLGTGCKDKDKNVSVTGSWYAEYDKTGTFYDPVIGSDIPYTRVVQFYQFDDEEMGYWTSFLFCEGSTYPDFQYGGLTGLEYADGAFNYTVNRDGTVRIGLINFHEFDSYDNFWTLRASADKITGTDERVTYTLVPASEDQIKRVKEWDDDFHGGSAEEDSLYTDIDDNDPATHPSE